MQALTKNIQLMIEKLDLINLIADFGHLLTKECNRLACNDEGMQSNSNGSAR
jgi:hypothetical protein